MRYGFSVVRRIVSTVPPLGTVTVSPEDACVGEQITVTCSLDVPNPNDNFVSIAAEYIVGNSDSPINALVVNGTGMHGGVDLSKLIAFIIFGSTKSVQGRIVLLSFASEDNDTRIGCGNIYQISGGGTSVLRETSNIRQAGEILLYI